jgi:hypothetical protein
MALSRELDEEGSKIIVPRFHCEPHENMSREKHVVSQL